MRVQHEKQTKRKAWDRHNGRCMNHAYPVRAHTPSWPTGLGKHQPTREDEACHARFGRTQRAAALYGPPGHAYVFLIYGMYDCFNVVTEPKDSPAAVLIRAVEPVPPLEGDTDGPGKLCRALRLNRAHNGEDLVNGALVWIERRNRKKVRIATSPRIGVDYAGDWLKKPWRFLDADSPWVSQPRTSKKLPRPS